MLEVWVWVGVGLMLCNDVTGGFSTGGSALAMSFVVSGSACVSVLLVKPSATRPVDQMSERYDENSVYFN